MAKKQPAQILIPEDTFFAEYKTIINHIVRANTPDSVEDGSICSWSGCMYETYGPELQHILTLANHKKTQKKVWTIIEGDDDTTIISAGYHLVNRMGYLVTEKPWVTGTEEVIIDTATDE